MESAIRVTAVPHVTMRPAIAFSERAREAAQTIYYAIVYKYLVGIFVAVACVAALWQVAAISPLWPVQLSTGMVLVALLFPVTAMLYLMANLRTRIDEIQDAALRYELHCVYFHQFEKPAAERKFRRYLLRRFSEYYNPWELAGFSFVAATIVFATEVLLVNQLGIDPTKRFDPTQMDTWSVLLTAGFFGALCGALLLIVKKYRSFDIYPSTYLHAAVALIIGTVAGAALSSILANEHVAFAIFAVGFFTATHMTFFGEFLRVRIANVAGINLPPSIATDLDRVVRNSDAIESLNALSLNSVGEFVKAEPFVLYLNLPQPIGVINGWLDEGLLHYYLANRIDALREANVTRFTQLIELAASHMEASSITWNDGSAVITGNPDLDAHLLLTVKSVVESKLHHRQLGIIWEKYRCTFFINGCAG